QASLPPYPAPPDQMPRSPHPDRDSQSRPTPRSPAPRNPATPPAYILYGTACMTSVPTTDPSQFLFHPFPARWASPLIPGSTAKPAPTYALLPPSRWHHRGGTPRFAGSHLHYAIYFPSAWPVRFPALP